MIPARSAISRFRRDLTVGTALNVALAAAALFAIVFQGGIGSGAAGTVMLVTVGGVWLTLTYQSIKGSRLAARSPMLIAQGQLDAAEHQIEEALASFSLFRTAKLLSLHHLAVLRHAQKRWEESVQLSRALLNQRLGSLKGLGCQSRLILAEALLQMGDLPAAHEALSELYRHRLTLAEALSLLEVQLDYQTRINGWDAMLEAVGTKVQMAELMASATAAQVQALLALAALKMGRRDLAQWLRRRVELLADAADLTRARPMLCELFAASGAQPDTGEPPRPSAHI